GAQLAVGRVAGVARDGAYGRQRTVDSSLSDLDRRGEHFVEAANALAVMPPERVVELSGPGFEVGDQAIVGDDRFHCPRQRDEAPAAELDASGRRDHLFEL